MKLPQKFVEVFRRRIVGCALTLALAWALSGNATTSAQAPGVNREYPLKAAFLYNFGNYIEWPADTFASADAPFVVGVMGTNPFGTVLNDVAATKTLHGRSIVIRPVVDESEVAACQILFICAGVGEIERLAVINSSRDKHVLIVGETKDLAAQGAVINFFVEQNKVRFEVNAQAARERDLKISSKLMSLAKLVEPRRVAGK